jgi:hypothetical protein
MSEHEHEFCDRVRMALLRAEPLDHAAATHRASCARCAELTPALEALAGALMAPVPEPSAALQARVADAAAPLLAANARTAREAAVAAEAPAARNVSFVSAAAAPRTIDGARLATALLPAVLLFPLLVVVDVALLRTLHGVLASILPATLTTYLVLSYGALLGALVCLTFGAIPLLVQRQAPVVWKERHV